MELAKDTRDRIFAAADSLYDQAGRAAFPTVDAVRKTARANMNDASAGMKEWRRAQTAQAAPVAVQVPEVVQQASSAALVDVKERQAELNELKLKLTAATAATETADARTVEIERRAADLRIELDHGHQEAAQSRAELVGVRQTHTAEVEVLRAELTASQGKAEGAAEKAATTTDALRTELATVKAKAEAAQDTHQEHRKLVAAEAHRAAERLTTTQAERDQAQKNAGKAREEAAALRGQVDAIKEQNAQLLQTLKIQSEKQPSKDKRD
jgi:colicin import membrane protein